MPLVSVIIPAYNQARYLGEAIDSVLSQTLHDFELIVVNDGSPDETAEVVASYQDPRLRYFYQENRGLPAARNTGIRESNAPLIALLDADDLFHPEKLSIASTLFEQHPDAGLVYNGRLTITNEGHPLLIRSGSPSVTLQDLVLGYPFAPSDVIVRREWLERVGMYDERFVVNGEDLDLHIRLSLAGCTFIGLPQALNYRRMHAGRTFGNIEMKLASHLSALDTAFKDTRCTPQVREVREWAYSNQYLVHAGLALNQGQAELGLTYLSKAAELRPALQNAHVMAKQLLWQSLSDGGNHEGWLRHVSSHLTDEWQDLNAELGRWAITQGYFVRGLVDILWERNSSGQALIEQGTTSGIPVDLHYLGLIKEQLLQIQLNYGDAAADEAFQRTNAALRLLLDQKDLNRFQSTYSFDQALKKYQEQQYPEVIAGMIDSFSSYPQLLLNRGALSITVRSLLRTLRT